MTHTRRFQQKILKWFDDHGRKTLPWQQNKTPYRVWVSEIMLQQTQVQTVIPYFERFMQHFPSLQDLARANENDVLHLWAGLGYYSRARNLHQAAIRIYTVHKNKFPNTLQALQTLPGIGPSTASAIMAIAYQKKATILDGNVKRVLSRFHGIQEPINEKSVEKKLWSHAESHTPSRRIADYTQAIMDLGALICTRRRPSCALCPVTLDCVARQKKIVSQLPFIKKKEPLPLKSMIAFIFINDKNKILLIKRPSRGIWGGLWSLPEIYSDLSEQTMRQFCYEHYNLKLIHYEKLPLIKHRFTHFRLNLFPIMVNVSKAIKVKNESHIWYDLGKPAKVGLPKPISFILRRINDKTNLLCQIK